MNTVHVLLAGDRQYDPFLLEGRNKCLLEFPSGRLLDLTLKAFASASRVDRLIVVGPIELAEFFPSTLNGKEVTFLPQTSSFSENIRLALSWVEAHGLGNRAIFVTNDAPFLTGQELDLFADDVSASNADIAIAVSRIPRLTVSDPLTSQYVRSIVALKDGLYLIANQVALSTSTIPLLETVQNIFDLRKQSRYATSLRTILFLLSRKKNISAISIWFKLILMKKLWLWRPESGSIERLGVSLHEVEGGLNGLTGDLSARIIELPGSMGCFDADTPDQLQALRSAMMKETGEVAMEPKYA